MGPDFPALAARSGADDVRTSIGSFTTGGSSTGFRCRFDSVCRRFRCRFVDVIVDCGGCIGTTRSIYIHRGRGGVFRPSKSTQSRSANPMHRPRPVTASRSEVDGESAGDAEESAGEDDEESSVELAPASGGSAIAMPWAIRYRHTDS